MLISEEGLKAEIIPIFHKIYLNVVQKWHKKLSTLFRINSTKHISY